jgi:hypothetical protein
VIYGGRLLFIYGTLHWFPVPLGQFMAAHQLSAAGLTDALIFMAVAMALARSALLSGVRPRGRTPRRRRDGRGGGRPPPPPPLRRRDGRVGHGREHHPVTGPNRSNQPQPGERPRKKEPEP